MAFLNDNGVEAAAFKPHNKRFFQVIALKGFRSGQLTSPDREAFEKRLQRLGRAWKSQGLGPDFSQSGIYLDLYEGERIAESIVIKRALP